VRSRPSESHVGSGVQSSGDQQKNTHTQRGPSSNQPSSASGRKGPASSQDTPTDQKEGFPSQTHLGVKTGRQSSGKEERVSEKKGEQPSANSSDNLC
jgi:hypothetical protein